jgi:hypothetical protein
MANGGNEQVAEVVVKPQSLASIGTLVITPLGGTCTFDPQTEEGAQLILDCILKELPLLADEVNKFINVRHVFSQEIIGEPDIRGEYHPWTRIVVFDENLKPYSCGSMGVEKALAAMFAIRGSKAEFVPPVRCEVKRKQLEKDRVWMYLEPDIKSLLAKPGSQEAANRTRPRGR